MDWRIRRTLTVMNREIAMPLRIATLAGRVNLSPSRFSHLFRRDTGHSPARYLHDLRLDCALTLLQGSTLSVKEIMAAVGCNDPSHFARDFSLRHGVSPSVFRAQAQPSSSRNGQQTADSANDPLLGSGPDPFIFEIERDERAKGA